MNANQKPNSYQNTPYQPLQAGQKKDISDSHSTSTYFLKTSGIHALDASPSNNSILSSLVLDRQTKDKVQTLNAFDWKRTISDTYFDLDVSFRQPNTFSGFLQHAKLLNVGVSHYHANTVHYNRSVESSGYADDSILMTFPIKPAKEDSIRSRVEVNFA